MMKRKTGWLCLLLALLLICSACGGGKDASSPGDETTQAETADTAAEDESEAVSENDSSEESAAPRVPLGQLDVEVSRVDCAGMDWKEAYLSILQSEPEILDPAAWTQFALIYVDYDEIPELVIDSGNQETGCRILTYAAEAVSVLQTNRLWFTYIETENLLCNSDGLMDDFFDIVCSIEDGEWVQTASGHYDGMLGWDEKTNRPICERYSWNGQEVTMAEYYVALRQVYDTARGKAPEEYCGAEEIVTLLSK